LVRRIEDRQTLPEIPRSHARKLKWNMDLQDFLK
jgi:hypothetical protein